MSGWCASAIRELVPARLWVPHEVIGRLRNLHPPLPPTTTTAARTRFPCPLSASSFPSCCKHTKRLSSRRGAASHRHLVHSQISGARSRCVAEHRLKWQAYLALHRFSEILVRFHGTYWARTSLHRAFRSFEPTCLALDVAGCVGSSSPTTRAPHQLGVGRRVGRCLEELEGSANLHARHESVMRGVRSRTAVRSVRPSSLPLSRYGSVPAPTP